MLPVLLRNLPEVELGHDAPGPLDVPRAPASAVDRALPDARLAVRERAPDRRERSSSGRSRRTCGTCRGTASRTSSRPLAPSPSPGAWRLRRRDAPTIAWSPLCEPPRTPDEPERVPVASVEAAARSRGAGRAAHGVERVPEVDASDAATGLDRVVLATERRQRERQVQRRRARVIVPSHGVPPPVAVYVVVGIDRHRDRHRSRASSATGAGPLAAQQAAADHGRAALHAELAEDDGPALPRPTGSHWLRPIPGSDPRRVGPVVPVVHRERSGRRRELERQAIGERATAGRARDVVDAGSPVARRPSR